MKALINGCMPELILICASLSIFVMSGTARNSFCIIFVLPQLRHTKRKDREIEKEVVDNILLANYAP